MPSGGIFVKVGDGLVVLQQTAYDSEDVLQAALESYPEVIAGATTTGESEAASCSDRRACSGDRG